MEANKIVLNGKVILDLTGDTAQKNDVLMPKTFHLPSGQQSQGNMKKATFESRQVEPTREGQIVKPITSDYLSQVAVLPIGDEYIDSSSIDEINVLLG